jgi:hypothetical protein
MRRAAAIFVLLLVLAIAGVAAQINQAIFMGGTIVAASNIIIVQKVCSVTGCTGTTANANCKQTGTSGSFGCLLATTTTGNALIVLENDFNGNTTPSVPTGTGATFTQDCSVLQGAQIGRVLSFSAPNITGQTTPTITINPGASTATSVIVLEVSGLPASSPFDACSPAFVNNGTATTWTSGSLAAAQTDLAFGCALIGTSATTAFTGGDVWGTFLNSPQAADAETFGCAPILNGLQTLFTGVGSSGASASYYGLVILYKSAVAGSAPSGNSVTAYSDFETSTNGTTVTAAILSAGSHGAAARTDAWAAGTGFTVATASQLNNATQNSTNGTAYPAGTGTRGLAYNLATSPVQTVSFTFPANVAQASAGMMFSISDNSQLYSVLAIHDSAAGFIDAQVQTGGTPTILSECPATAGSPITIALNTTYGLELVAVQNASSTLKVYQAGSLLGTSTCTYLNNPAKSVQVGQTHNAIGTGTLAFDNLHIDALNGSVLLP